MGLTPEALHSTYASAKRGLSYYSPGTTDYNVCEAVMTLVNHIWEVEEKNRTLAAELKAAKEYKLYQR